MTIGLSLSYSASCVRQAERVPGPREATEEAAIAASVQTFYTSHNWQLFFLQGTKTLGYELWEDFGFKVPDNIIVLTGTGLKTTSFYAARQNKN